MNHLIDEAIEQLAGGKKIVLATIAANQGSAPRHEGTQMIVGEDGRISGTVGGGALEARVIKTALQLIQAETSGDMEYDLTPKDAAQLGMICGGQGRITLQFLKPGDEKDHGFVNHFAAASQATAYVFGAGHCGEKLVPVLSFVGFKTVVLDDRAEFANKERFGLADSVRVISSFENSLEGLPIDGDSYIIIVTRGHLHDRTVLKQALRTQAGYIGMIGSRTKIRATYDALRQEGFTEQDLARVYAPIGLDIKAETPEEIALSIASQLVKIRAEKRK